MEPAEEHGKIPGNRWLIRHSGRSGEVTRNPVFTLWIPACAGMTEYISSLSSG